MGRKPAIEEAGPMIQWSVRTTTRARDALTAAAKARGISVGIYLDRLTHGSSDEPASAAPTTKPPEALRGDAPHDRVKAVPASRNKRTSAEAETERQARRQEIARAALARFDTAGDVPTLPSFGPDTPLHTQEIGDDPPPGPNPEQCRHPLTEALPTGLRRCRACGLTAAPTLFT